LECKFWDEFNYALPKEKFYQIEATKQICSTVNVSNDCFDQEWLFKIDESGLVK